MMLIPEIDMPGHSAAFVRATGHDMQSAQGMKILKDLMEEICTEVFPDAPWIHIGTDEVQFTHPSFVPEMVAHIRGLGKRVISWNPGWKYAPGEIDATQLWSYRGKAQPGIPAIDSRFHYINHFDAFGDIVALYNSRIYNTQKGNDDIAGAILAIWNDRMLEDEAQIMLQNHFYPNILALAERAWRGGGTEYFDKKGVILPTDPHDSVFRSFADFERRMLWHKTNTFSGIDFPYVKQTDIRWSVTDPFPNEGDLSAEFPPERALSDNFIYNGQTYGTHPAVGAGIYLRHVWGTTVPAFFAEPKENHTAYAWTWVWSPRKQTVGLWATTQDYSRSESDLPPPQGEWDYRKSRIWLNDQAIIPPKWENSHTQKSNEITLKNENFTARKPLPVQLKRGWNKVLLKLPVGKFSTPEVRLQKWMFNFVFVTPDGMDRVEGLIYSPLKSDKRTNSHSRFNQSHVFSMESLSDTTLHEGLAGCFFGKQDNWLILAGGSSFPEGKPWEGGVKQLSGRVFVFGQQADGNLDLLYQGDDLPVPLAEGAYASVAGGILCMGGQTPEGITAHCRLLSFNGVSVTATSFPSLPLPVKNASATVIGTRVYLLGGELADGTSSNQFLVLDTYNLQNGWQPLAHFPIAVSGSAITAQQDGEEISLFVFGGRAKTTAEPTSFFSSVYHYRPSLGRWVQKRDIRPRNGSATPLAMAAASSVGGSHILLYGGDTGSVFGRVEAAINRGDLQARDVLWLNHPGFNRQILLYNTLTDTWFVAGETTRDPVAVTANLSDGNSVYIAGGEIRPGIRSPFITRLYYTSQPRFGGVNYWVLALYFGGMLLLGFFFMNRNKSTDHFFKASGRIPWWAAGISIFATTLSAITFLSIPAKTYATDWRMLIFNLTIILIVPVVIRYFLPFFRRFSFDTAYAYLEERFSRNVRWLASTLFVFFMVSRIAIVLFLPSLALNAVTGFDIYLSIIIMGVVTIVYSTSGGMEAVVWGDVIQGFILVFGALSAFIFMIMGIEGGLGEFWRTSIAFHKFHTLDIRFDFSQPVFWVVLIGGVANSLITYTSDQSIVQRYMSTKDEKATARSIWLNGILSVPVTILFFLIGTGLFAFYHDNPSQMMASNPNIDSVFPQFIVSEMPTGFAGLLIAAIFAAAMSTLSSNINSSSAVISSDFFKTSSHTCLLPRRCT